MSSYSDVSQNDRIFQICGEWYFNTREGIEGPFQDQLQAREKLVAYLEIFANLDLAGRGTPTRSATAKHGLLPMHMQWR